MCWSLVGGCAGVLGLVYGSLRKAVALGPSGSGARRVGWFVWLAVVTVEQDAGVVGEVREARLDLDPLASGSTRIIEGGDWLVLRASEELVPRGALVDNPTGITTIFARHCSARGAAPWRKGDEVVLLPPPQLAELADRAGGLVDAGLTVVQREQVGEDDDLWR